MLADGSQHQRSHRGLRDQRPDLSDDELIQHHDSNNTNQSTFRKSEDAEGQPSQSSGESGDSQRASPRRRKEQVYRNALNARHERLKKHLAEYLHINVQLPNARPLLLLARKTATIDQLAQQIEAEYALLNAHDAALAASATVEQLNDTTAGSNAALAANAHLVAEQETAALASSNSLNIVASLSSSSSPPFEPLEVGLLYDTSQTPLLFSDLLGQVLENNSVVLVTNITRRTFFCLASWKDGKEASKADVQLKREIAEVQQ